MAGAEPSRAEVEALDSGIGWLEQPGLTVFRLLGREPRRALHGIVTQDVEGIAPGQGRLALLLAPKGQFRALMALFRPGDELLVVSPPGRGPELAASLDRYLALSRCRLEPLPCRTLALVGPRWVETAVALAVDPAPVAAGGVAARATAGGAQLWLWASLLGVPGALVVSADGAAHDEARAAAAAAGAVPVGALPLELARIVAGFPRWGAELTDRTLPPEVGLDRLAVSLRKGCYIGQETMARIATYGHVNRALVRVGEEGRPGGAPALPLGLVGAEGGAAVGELTSWALHPELGGVGLAVVQRRLAAAGTVVIGDGRRFRVGAPAGG